MLPNPPMPGQPVTAAWGAMLLDELSASRVFADGAGALPGATTMAGSPRRPAQSRDDARGDADYYPTRMASVRRCEPDPDGSPLSRVSADVLGLADFRKAGFATARHGRMWHVVRVSSPDGSAAVRYAPASVRARIWVDRAFIYDQRYVLEVAAVLKVGGSVVETLRMQGDDPGPKDLLRRVADAKHLFHLRASAAFETLQTEELVVEICVGWHNTMGSETSPDAVHVQAGWSGRFVYSTYVMVGGENRPIDFEHPVAAVTVGPDTLGIDPFGGEV